MLIRVTYYGVCDKCGKQYLHPSSPKLHICLKKENKVAGYHLTDIPRGKYGEISKIEEELAEIKDSVAQGNEIMELNELSDLYGALEAYLEKRFNKRFNMRDLAIMSDTTKRAFENGARKNRDG